TRGRPPRWSGRRRRHRPTEISPRRSRCTATRTSTASRAPRKTSHRRHSPPS
ncbi:uncharacterized protein METZ01_LOCUS112683, partial [marine metagenome]